MISCPNNECEEPITKLSVVTRTSWNLTTKEKTHVGDDYYCPKCTKELTEKTIQQIAMKQFKDSFQNS